MIRSRAIVLSVVRYSDSQSIVHCYTEAVGRVGFLVRRPRSARGGLRPSLFAPLSLLEVEWADRATASLQRLRTARLLLPYRSIPRDVRKGALVLFLSEFLSHALRADGGDKALFAYVFSALMWLDAASRGVANFHLTFLMHLAQFMGFAPNTEGYERGMGFDLEGGCFCARLAAPHVVPPAEAALLPLLLRMNFSTLHLFRFSRAQRERLLALIVAYYRLHLPSLPELRSAEVLRQVFGATAATTAEPAAGAKP